MTHPLTDAKCRDIANNICFRWPPYVDQGEVLYAEECMRAAYDVGRDEQLKDDMKWLKENLGEWLAYEDLWDMKTKIGIGMFINDLKKAMRPQEDNS